MKKSKVVLLGMAVFTVLIAFVSNSQKTEAAENINMNEGTVLTFDPSGTWKRIYSGVYESTSKGDYRYNDYSGEIKYAHVTANNHNIQAEYVVKDRMFDFTGTYSPSQSYFNGNTKIWVYTIDKVNGLNPVFRTTVSISQGALGTTLFVKANRSIVPNWSVLPNVENMSKVTIEPAYISLNVQ